MLGILVVLLILCLLKTFVSFLILIGAYKDPILASFEVYGRESVFSPVYAFIMWALVLMYLSMFLYLDAGVVLTIGAIIVIPLGIMNEGFLRFLEEHQERFRRFPAWYYQIVQRTDREERRRIAYHWLRLPIRTRILYNTHSPFFDTWLDQVLTTISS